MKILKLLLATMLTSALLISCTDDGTTTTSSVEIKTEETTTNTGSYATIDTTPEVETETEYDSSEADALYEDNGVIRSSVSLAQSDYLLSGHTGDVEYFIRTTLNEDGFTNIEVCPENATDENFWQTPWTSHEWNAKSQMAQDALNLGDFHIIIGDGGEVLVATLSTELYDLAEELSGGQEYDYVEGVDYINMSKYITPDMTDEEVESGYIDFVNACLEIEIIGQEIADIMMEYFDVDMIREQAEIESKLD